MIYKKIFSLIVLMLIVSCGKSNHELYSAKKPEFKFDEFFNGEIKAWGIIQNRKGQVTRKFIASILATHENDEITLDEDFVFDDGVISKRVWKINKIKDNEYQGTAGDVEGLAKGELMGNALNWTYKLEIPYNDDSFTLTLDDWMWAFNDDVIMSHTKMTKFGFNVGEINIFMQKSK